MSIEQAKKLYELDGEAKKIALEFYEEESLITPTYPNTWEKCFSKETVSCVDNHSCILSEFNVKPSQFTKNRVNTKAQAQAILALTQLLMCRDAYRNGWNPDLSQKRQIRRASLIVEHGEWSQAYYWSQAEIFSFEKKEQAQAFLENFKDLLEQVKPLFL